MTGSSDASRRMGANDGTSRRPSRREPSPSGRRLAPPVITAKPLRGDEVREPGYDKFTESLDQPRSEKATFAMNLIANQSGNCRPQPSAHRRLMVAAKPICRAFTAHPPKKTTSRSNRPACDKRQENLLHDLADSFVRQKRVNLTCAGHFWPTPVTGHQPTAPAYRKGANGRHSSSGEHEETKPQNLSSSHCGNAGCL